MLMKVKIILKYLFSFLFFLSSLILILLLIIKFSVFNKDYLLNTLNENNYYESINNEIKEEMEDFITSSGFSKEILDNIYTKEDVTNDINLYIDSLYLGNKLILNKENINKKLKENIDNYLKENNVDVVNNNDIDSFISEVVDIYKDEIMLYNTLDSFINSFNKISNILNYGIIILLVITIILFIVNIKFRSYYLSSFMSVGLILLFLRMVIYEKIDVINILIVSEEFSLILKNIITLIGTLLLKFGIIFIIIGLVLMLVIKCQQEKRKRINN